MEKQLAELGERFGEAQDESERVDAAEDERYGLQSASALPADLADAKARHRRLQEVQKQLAEAAAARRRKGLKTPAQLPGTDSDSTGPNIMELQQRGIEFLSFASTEETTEGNAAVRTDPRQPVPEEAWAKLPISPQTKEAGQVVLGIGPRRERVLLPPW